MSIKPYPAAFPTPSKRDFQTPLPKAKASRRPMGRLEAFALGNGVWKSLLDGVGNAAGYGFMLILVAFFRELFGSGKLYGYQIIPESFYEMGYVNNGFMLLSPMALITVGVIIWLQRARNRKLIEKG